MSRTAIQNATDRLRTLALQTAPGARERGRAITDEERDAIAEVLDELHRLHVVVAGQEARIKELLTIHEKKRPQKPQGARNAKPSTRSRRAN
jgi:hypothetical protein